MSIKSGSKYYPLYKHLQNCNQDAVTLTFSEIEALMGCALPASAAKKKNWWSNRDSPSALPDTLICSGMISAELNGKPCPYAQDGHLPDPVPLDKSDPDYSPDKGNHGDLCPPCAKHQLAHLGHWQGHGQQTFPEELLPLRLFKCRMWLWLVVPGLHDVDPSRLRPA